MTLESCIQSLQLQYQKDTAQSANISKLTSDARWANKVSCLQEVWWTTKVREYIKTFDEQWPIEYTGALVHQSASTWASLIDTSGLKQYGWMAVQLVLICIMAYVIWKFTRVWLKFLYIFANFHRIKYYKVTLPRAEGKNDREDQKDLAKDMKEKIGRMWQVYTNLGKLGTLSAKDEIMRWLFQKPKVSFIYHYEKGQLFFIVATYPEYESIVHSAIWSQYADASIEVIDKPNMSSKKYTERMPLESQKDSIYTIRMYKQANDDQMNNIIDAISSVSKYDTVSIVMNISPLWEEWNDKAKKKVDRLYKNLSISSPFLILLKPWKLLWFLFKWPKMQKRDEDVSMVRMVKAKEDTINAMAEEAGSRAFETWLMIVVSSDDETRADDALKNIISAYSVYTDEYGNELEYPTRDADLIPFIVKPLWKLSVNFLMTHLIYVSNVFCVNELASLFHFPARIYNRSDAIQWMPYKLIAPPETLPQLTQENGYIMSGIIAEKYKWGELSEILDESKYRKHRAIGEKTSREDKLIPFEKLSAKQQALVQPIEQDGKKMAKVQVDKKTKWFKLFKDGILLWVNIYRNLLSPVYMKRNDRTRHHYMIGKSGTGKSVFLESMARQDIWNGDGMCLIDPHGDLAEWLLQYIPKERAKDVVFFDAGNEERPMWLNLYEINSIDEADRTVNDATEIFLKMFGPEIFGPRIQEYFKYGSLTLLEDLEDKPTLLDVTRLFTDDAFREYKVSKVKNAVVRNFREKTYNAMGDREKQEIIPYFSSKFVSFNTNRLIRNIIGQTHSAFDFEDIMNNKKILIISLSKGKIGELNAQLLGMIIVSKIYNAAMARARMDEKDRKDFYLYVDEFQNFISGTFADILSEARKYKLCLIMAHQYIAQLEWGWGNNIGQDKWGKSDVKAAVFGNVGTMMSFKVGAPDAEFLEKEYSPTLSAQDIIGIANYKSYVKLNIDNSTTRPFSMNSIYTNDYKNKKIAEILKEYCAKKYGRKREFVDAEITARLGMTVDEKVLDTIPAPEEENTSPEQSQPTDKTQTTTDQENTTTPNTTDTNTQSQS